MIHSFAAALRRSNQMMRPAANLGRATRSFHKDMTGFMIDTALAPLAAFQPKKAKPRKAPAAKTAGTLGATLRQLRAAQAFAPGAMAGASGREETPSILKGARYLAQTHRSAAGSRGYKLYLPASEPKRPRGLILMLHGCSQNPDDFALGTHMNAMAEKHGLVIAYPAQTGRHNAGSCWNWFRPGHQVRGVGEPAILASLTRKLMKDYGLGRDATFVAGLSAGGAMAAILADVYPDVFSAAGVHSGLARGAASNVVSAMSAMRSGGEAEERAPAEATGSDPVRRIIFQGDADSTVHPSNAAMIVAAAMGRDAVPAKTGNRSVRGRGYARSDFAGPDGAVQLELWMLEGAGHAWSGGRAAGSYTDANGPDASAQMIRFFMAESG